MTIKEKLREIKELDRRADFILRQIDAEENRIRTVDYATDKVQSCNSSDLSNAVAKIDEYKRRLNLCIDDLYDKKNEMKNLIDQELSGAMWDVMSHYYFSSGSTWEKVAADLNFSVQHVKRLHGGALLILNKKSCG